MPAYPPLTAFMPHRPPMLFLDALLAHDDTSVVVEKTFRADDVFVENGAVSSFVVLELFAQAAAAHFGYAGLQRGGQFTSGALLGTRKIDLHVPTLAVGEAMQVHAKQTFAMPPAAQYECVLVLARDPSHVLAEGSITVALGPPPPA